jgi:pentatricopeptide repeat protein
MQEEGLQSDRVTLGGVLNACASLVALKEGRDTHEQIIQRGWESDVFMMSLVDMYAKCGSMEDACKVFKKTPSCDVVTLDIWISKMWARPEGTGTIPTNAAGRSPANPSLLWVC